MNYDVLHKRMLLLRKIKTYKGEINIKNKCISSIRDTLAYEDTVDLCQFYQ